MSLESLESATIIFIEQDSFSQNEQFSYIAHKSAYEKMYIRCFKNNIALGIINFTIPVLASKDSADV